MKDNEFNHFFQTWKEVCNDNKEILLENWTNNKTFTNLILYNDNSIVSQIANKMQLLCYTGDRTGYYGIDAVFYKNNNRVQNTGDQTWLTKIEIAFEHENVFSSYLYTEISRLLTSNANLKILVTYPNKNKNRIFDELRKCCNNINDSILVIFGSINKKDIIWDYQTICNIKN